MRSIDPSGTITTVAGTGDQCSAAGCGDGGPARSAQLAAANAVAVDPLGVLLIADGTAGVRRVAVDGTISTVAPGTKTGDVVSVAVSGDGTIYAASRSPDLIIKIDPTSGAVTPAVGTGTSGYNGNTNSLGSLLPGTQVQVNQPGGLSVDLDGNVVFADTANHLIRAYVPSSGHVIDDLAGAITEGGTPQGGFNGDGHWAPDTQLNQPLGVDRDPWPAAHRRRHRQPAGAPSGARPAGRRRRAARHRGRDLVPGARDLDVRAAPEHARRGDAS